MTATAATSACTSREGMLSRGGSAAAGEKPASAIRSWIAPAIAQLKELGPYVVLELVLPGGSLMAIFLWLYRRAASPSPMRAWRWGWADEHETERSTRA